MPTTYTVTLSDAEQKALAYVAVSPEEWIDNAVKERCRLAIEKIIKEEVDRLLDAGLPIPSSRDDIVMSAPIKSAAEQSIKKESN